MEENYESIGKRIQTIKDRLCYRNNKLQKYLGYALSLKFKRENVEELIRSIKKCRLTNEESSKFRKIFKKYEISQSGESLKTLLCSGELEKVEKIDSEKEKILNNIISILIKYSLYEFIRIEFNISKESNESTVRRENSTEILSHDVNSYPMMPVSDINNVAPKIYIPINYSMTVPTISVKSCIKRQTKIDYCPE